MGKNALKQIFILEPNEKKNNKRLKRKMCSYSERADTKVSSTALHGKTSGRHCRLPHTKGQPTSSYSFMRVSFVSISRAEALTFAFARRYVLSMAQTAQRDCRTTAASAWRVFVFVRIIYSSSELMLSLLKV